MQSYLNRWNKISLRKNKAKEVKPDINSEDDFRFLWLFTESYNVDLIPIKEEIITPENVFPDCIRVLYE